MAYQVAPVLVTLNDLEGHLPVAGLLSAIRRTFVQYLPDFNRQRERAVPQRQLGFLFSTHFCQFW